MRRSEILLGTYPLQKDMRIRLPKQILTNLPIEVGSMLEIYLNKNNTELILRINDKSKENLLEKK